MSYIGTDADGEAAKLRLFGRTQATKADGSTFTVPGLAEISKRVLWGSIWNRDTLELRERVFITISALMGMQRYDYAKIHIEGARHIGVTREELGELMLQMTFYTGMPVVHTGLRLIAEVFADDDAAEHAAGAR